MTAMTAMRPRPRTALMMSLCCLAAGLTAGCGTSGNERAGEPGGVVSAAAVPASPKPSSQASPVLTLAFAGDTHFYGRTAGLLANPKTAFGRITPTLSSADFTVLNLETAVTNRGTPQPKTYHFRAKASAFEALRAAGVDAVSLANNHALDYGQVGFTDTLDNAEKANFPIFGAGHDITEAYRPLITEVRGVRIAILGFSQIRELAAAWAATDNRPGLAMAMDVDRAVQAVAAARKQADLVIVFPHWGQERNGCPIARQKEFADRMAEAGADLIIGSHAHTLQGEGWLGNTYVAYGLGNFLWYCASASTATGVLRLKVRGREVISSELVPATVSSTGQPVPLTGSAATKARQRFANLRSCTGLTDKPR